MLWILGVVLIAFWFLLRLFFTKAASHISCY